jgi:acyl carrier protein
MFDELRQIVSEKFQLDPETITMESTLEDLGLDSLDIVELAMTIEETWGQHVTDDELIAAQRLDAVIGLVGGRPRETNV